MHSIKVTYSFRSWVSVLFDGKLELPLTFHHPEFRHPSRDVSRNLPCLLPIKRSQDYISTEIEILYILLSFFATRVKTLAGVNAMGFQVQFFSMLRIKDFLGAEVSCRDVKQFGRNQVVSYP